MLDIVFHVVEHLCVTDRFSRVELLPRVLAVCTTMRNSFSEMEKRRLDLVEELRGGNLPPSPAPESRIDRYTRWQIFAPSRQVHKSMAAIISTVTTEMDQPYLYGSSLNCATCAAVRDSVRRDKWHYICIYRWLSSKDSRFYNAVRRLRGSRKATKVYCSQYDSSYQTRRPADAVTFNTKTGRLVVYTSCTLPEGVVRFYDRNTNSLIWSRRQTATE
jgi:hypothetical protein